MNVLPLVSAFILIFAVCTYTFVHTLKVAIQEKFHYSGAMAVTRNYTNKLQSQSYQAQKGKDLHPKKTQASKKNDKIQFVSPRDKVNRHNGRKLHIRALVSDQKNPQLEKVALTLIKNIYQSSSLYKPEMEKEILNVILTTLKAHPTIKTFEELLTKLSQEDIPLFYKLIKGTQHYELKKNIGYPALGDFISIDLKSKSKPINFNAASRPVLEALFGEDLTKQIINEERQKWDIDHKKKTLLKQEFIPFLQKIKKNLVDFEALLSFDNSKQERTQEIIQDGETKLQIRINK